MVAHVGVTIVGTGSERSDSWPGGERMVRLFIVLVSVNLSSSQAGMSESRAPSAGCMPRTGVRAVGGVGGGLPAWRSDHCRARVSGASAARCLSDILGNFDDVVDRIPGAPVRV